MINLRKEHCLCVSNDYWVFTRLRLDQKAEINKYSFSIVLVSFHYYLEKSCGVLLKRDTKTKLKDTKTYTTQLLLLGKFEYGGGPIFKVVLEC